MNLKLKNFLLFTTLFILNLNIVNAVTTITFEGDYGLKNILLGVYLLFHLMIWYYIYTKTSPIKINGDNLLSSSMNAVTRLLCYTWFFVIFYMGKAVLLISSSSDFLETKLFLFNMLYFITIFFLALFGVLVFIKHSSKISGLTDFLSAFIYEVKNGE